MVRELGLLAGDPETKERILREAKERRRFDGQIERFEAWRTEQIRLISEKYLFLSGVARHAKNVLAHLSNCAQSWDCLGHFYHAEAQLSVAFDWFTFAKASSWLEIDSTAREIFEAWSQRAA
jgi:hypothetical protein